jgi:alpha-tubulin suppressor-like RCC1 family protein
VDEVTLYAIGWNKHGQLGFGHNTNLNVPKEVPFFEDPAVGRIQMVECGAAHSVVLAQSKKLYVFGNNMYGQLGLGGYAHVSTPTPVSGLQDVCQVACGSHHTLVGTADKRALACGWNASGQLGLNHFRDQDTFQTIDELAGKQMQLVACGGSHSFVLTSEDELFGFGCNKKGQLGLGWLGNAGEELLVLYAAL